MFIPIITAALTLAGALGLVLSSLAHTTPASEPIFNAAAICLVTGPIVFFSYVIIGLCLEFKSINRKPEVTTVPRPVSPPMPSLGEVKFDQWIPEGLRRERKGPLGRIVGRAVNI